MRQPHLPILLLDDFPDSCAAVTTWLEMEGWVVVPVTSAEAALDALGRRPFAAVVMEPYLHAGEAMHVAEAARDSRFGRPLVVSMSARGRQGDVSYEPTLFDINLLKPVPMESLGRILAPLRSLQANDGDGGNGVTGRR